MKFEWDEDVYDTPDEKQKTQEHTKVRSSRMSSSPRYSENLAYDDTSDTECDEDERKHTFEYDKTYDECVGPSF